DGKGGGQVTVDGQPLTSGGRVPRKFAARAERAARDAVRQAQGQGAGPGEVRIHGENNSVVTTTTSGDQVHITRSTSRKKED
ncbi:hypothetical protein G3M53_67720, partial [Streptomyces sp. SID7982]|nr:hypothetical protein [Streptomyces sp. SID7982]